MCAKLRTLPKTDGHTCCDLLLLVRNDLDFQALPCKKTTFFSSIPSPYKSPKQKFSVSPPVNLQQIASQFLPQYKDFVWSCQHAFAFVFKNLFAGRIRKNSLRKRGNISAKLEVNFCHPADFNKVCCICVCKC